MQWAGLNPRQAAEKLGVDASYPWKLIHQKRKPGLDFALSIQRVTAQPRADGEVWTEPPIRVEEWSEAAPSETSGTTPEVA